MTIAKQTNKILCLVMAVSMLLSGQALAAGGEMEGAGSATIQFSQPGGLYEEAFTLTLTTTEEDAVIRYTLDGSDPTGESVAYDDGITIEDRTEDENVLSAIVTTGGGRGGMGGFPNMGQMARPGGDAAPAGDAGTPPAAAEGGTAPEGEAPPADDAQAAGGTQPAADAQPVADTQPADAQARRQQRGGGGGGFGGFGGENTTPPEENVFKGTVIKAALFSEDGTRLSDIQVESYFVAENIFTRYGDLAVISLVTDADNLYDEETGIFVNPNGSGAEWERPVHIEMFEADGTQVISQDVGARISGNSTRNNAQKSIRLYSKAGYDDENPVFEYEIFEGLLDGTGEDTLTTFKRLVLRNSGNDNNNTQFRDALMQDLADGLDVDSQATRACVVFINGEFWGVYNLRERYDDHYFANVYGVDTADVTVLEISNSSTTAEVSDGEADDIDYYNEMWNFFNDNDMSDADNYAKAQTYIDLDNFIDYYIVNIYSGNTDWPANNNVFWRYKTENGGYDENAAIEELDGRYRWVLKDMDFGFGQMGAVSSDTLAHAMSDAEGRGGFGGMDFGNMPDMAALEDMSETEIMETIAGMMEENGFEMPEGMEMMPGMGGDMQMPEGMEGGEMPQMPEGDGTQAAPEAGGWAMPGMAEGEEGGRGGMGGMGFTNSASTLIFRKLLENEDFLAQFVNRFCDVMNTNYDADYVTSRIGEFQAEREDAMAEHITRYPGSLSSIEDWEKNIQSMITYAQARAGYVQGFLKDAFLLGDVVTVTLKTDAQMGYVRMNDMDIAEGTKGVTDADSWTGEYFAGMEQTFTAVPLDGYEFVKFVVTDVASGETAEYTEDVVTRTLGDAGLVVEAVFTAK